MVASIGSIQTYGHSDPEYLRILQELRKLGIAPSGNKNTDKAKLEQAKAELIEKIQAKNQEEQRQDLEVLPIEDIYETQDTERMQLEESRLGAMTVAELNKLYFGLV